MEDEKNVSTPAPPEIEDNVEVAFEEVIKAGLDLRAEKRRMNVYDITMNVDGMNIGIGTLHLLRDVTSRHKVIIEVGGDK